MAYGEVEHWKSSWAAPDIPLAIMLFTMIASLHAF